MVLEEAVEHLDPGGRQPLGLVAQPGDAAGAVGRLAAVVGVLDVQPDQRQPAARTGVREDAVQHAVEAGPEAVLAGRGTVVPGAPLVRVPPGADVDLDGVGAVADRGVHPVEGVHPVRDGVDRPARVGGLRGGGERGGAEDRAQRRHQGGQGPQTGSAPAGVELIRRHEVAPSLSFVVRRYSICQFPVNRYHQQGVDTR